MERQKPVLDFKITKAPIGSSCESGQLHDVSSGMRSFRPVFNMEKCVKCLQCFLYCPDGAIDKSTGAPELDLNYCKGCGICEKICKLDAITMVKEGDCE